MRPFCLDAYSDEQVFRFNAREGSNADRFVATLKGADGKRVPYKGWPPRIPVGAYVRAVRLALRPVVPR